MASSLPVTPQTSPRRSNFTESTSKPIIVIVNPTTPEVSETDSRSSSPSSQPSSSPPAIRRSTYTSLLAKIARDAHLLTITSLETLEETLSQHGPRIVGFIIASTAILHPAHHALAVHLAALAHNNSENNNESESESESTPRIYTVLFALSFPSDAIATPLLFASFMRNIFHLPWRLSGMTDQKVKTKLRASVLRKLGQRVYRVRYCVRSVFLRNVKLADKVVVATGEFPIGGQRLLEFDGSVWLGGGMDFELEGGGAGNETASTDEEMEEWESEESEGTAVGGDFGDAWSFSGEDDAAAAVTATSTVPDPVGTGEAMQVDEDAGFLADVEDNEADVLDMHPIVTTTFLLNCTVNSTRPVDDALSDNSTFFSPTSLLTNSPDTVSTPATTTVASSVEDEDDADANEAEEEEEAEESSIHTTNANNLLPIDEASASHSDSNAHHLPMTMTIPTIPLLFQATQSTLNGTTPTSPSSSSNHTPSPPRPTEWVPSDDEGTSVDICCADSPIVIHEFKRPVVREGARVFVPSGYVGFVGHVDDSRSMSTLILGMCAVPRAV